MSRKIFFMACFYLFLVLPTEGKAQQKDSLARPQEVWVGLDLLGWFNNMVDATYIMPEAAFKYRFGRHGAINLFAGYHWVERDSLFGNIEYSNRGWYVKSGPELLVPLKKTNTNFLTFSGNLVYSSFREDASVLFRYRPEAFRVDIGAGNSYSFNASNRSDAYAFELQQGVWLKHKKLSAFFSQRLSWLLSRPVNRHIPVHYIPGTGTYTPHYDLIFRNRTGKVNKAFYALRLHLYYRLF